MSPPSQSSGLDPHAELYHNRLGISLFTESSVVRDVGKDAFAMYHPDNSNGDTREEFDRLRRARDVLQDSSARSSYIKFYELTDGAPATTELFESWQRKGEPCSPEHWVEQQHRNEAGDTSDSSPSGEDTGKKRDRLRETKGHDDLRDTRDSRRKNRDSSEDPIPDPVDENEGEDDSDDSRPSPPPSFDNTSGEEDVGPTGRFDNVNWGDPSIGDFTPSEDERGPPTGDSPSTPYGEDVPVGMPDPEEEEQNEEDGQDEEDEPEEKDTSTEVEDIPDSEKIISHSPTPGSDPTPEPTDQRDSNPQLSPQSAGGLGGEIMGLLSELKTSSGRSEFLSAVPTFPKSDNRIINGGLKVMKYVGLALFPLAILFGVIAMFAILAASAGGVMGIPSISIPITPATASNVGMFLGVLLSFLVAPVVSYVIVVVLTE